ncbi:MAG: helix-hairpin-helix domain-containing protein [Candidatus Sumerlaeota bacterium]|nr:helix-hairpin-helix domain-containing protein [Candidatus Sumerlaeota bacterium]
MAGRFRTLFDGMTRTEQRVLIGLILVASAAVAVRHGFYGGRDDFQLIATYDEENKKWTRAPGAAEANAQGISAVSGGALSQSQMLPGGKTDLNTASEGQMISIPGLGPAKARDVISYRQQHGPFRSIEDLDKVAGIGPKTIDHLRPYLAVGSLASSQASLAANSSETVVQVESPSSQSQSASNAARPDAAVSGAGNIATPKATPVKAVSPTPAAAKSTSGPPGKSAGAARININTASQSELESLPGIGPTLAARIIEYRKAHGAFKSLSELDQVSGIGAKRLSQIEPLVTVGGK